MNTARFPFPADVLIESCRQNGIVMAAVFGSMATGQATEHSDIDLLVEFMQPVSLLEFARVKAELSEVMERPVDLATPAMIGPDIRPSVLRDLLVLFDDRLPPNMP